MKTRGAVQFFVFFVLILAVAFPGCAQEESKAQKKAEAQLRVLHGSVIDKDENPIASSVVYLKNLKSQAVKTYIADDSGNYRFSGLDPNVDYQIHAEHGDMGNLTPRILRCVQSSELHPHNPQSNHRPYSPSCSSA